MISILPKYVINSIKVLEANGYDAYIVGGAVRDYYSDKTPTDYDLATSAPLDQIEEIFKKYKIKKYKKGHTYGIVIDGNYLEISTFDGNNLQEDLSNRDFTINSMAYSLTRGLIDPYNAISDIKKRILTTIKPPKEVFTKDPIRMLRLIRFSAMLRYEVPSDIVDYINAHAELINSVAKERINKELSLILTANLPSLYIKNYLMLFIEIIPQLKYTYKFDQKNPWHYLDVFEHTMLALDNTKPILVLRLAALLHDIEKPKCFSIDDRGIGHFYFHFKESAKTAEALLTELKYSNEVVSLVTKLVYFHDYKIEMKKSSVLKFLNKFGTKDLDLLFELKKADNNAQNPVLVAQNIPLDDIKRFIDEIKVSNEAYHINMLQIDGNQLLNLGFKNEYISMALEKILDKVMSQELKNEKNSLLEYAKNLLPNCNQ